MKIQCNWVLGPEGLDETPRDLNLEVVSLNKDHITKGELVVRDGLLDLLDHEGRSSILSGQLLTPIYGISLHAKLELEIDGAAYTRYIYHLAPNAIYALDGYLYFTSGDEVESIKSFTWMRNDVSFDRYQNQVRVGSKLRALLGDHETMEYLRVKQDPTLNPPESVNHLDGKVWAKDIKCLINIHLHQVSRLPHQRNLL